MPDNEGRGGSFGGKPVREKRKGENAIPLLQNFEGERRREKKQIE